MAVDLTISDPSTCLSSASYPVDHQREGQVQRIRTRPMKPVDIDAGIVSTYSSTRLDGSIAVEKSLKSRGNVIDT